MYIGETDFLFKIANLHFKIGTLSRSIIIKQHLYYAVI